MAITILELNKRLQGMQNYLQGNQLGTIMVRLGNEALVLVRNRVQEEGENAKGEKFKAYSKKPMLANFTSFKTKDAYNKIAGSKAKRKELKWVTIGGASGFASFLSVSAGTSKGSTNEGRGARLFEIPGGYKQFRELHGRPGDIVNFTFTGRMWGNIKLVSDMSELNMGVAIIKATEAEQKKKLEGNTKRRGEILALSKSEENRLAELYNVYIEAGLRKYGLL